MAILGDYMAMNDYNLVRLAEIFGEHHRISHWAVSVRCLKKGDFFQRIRRGASPTVDTYSHVARWLSDRWPADVPWPKDIERPTPSPGSTAALATTEASEFRLALGPSSKQEVLFIVKRLLERASVLLDEVDSINWDAVKALRKDALRIGKTLGPNGQIRHTAALALSLGLQPPTLYAVTAKFRDGGKGRSKPRVGTWERDALDALIESGDGRFSRWRQGIAA